MTINARELFGFELGTLDAVTIAKTKVPEIASNEITLDFSTCFVDYPATSGLTDAVLCAFKKIPGKKTLRLVFDDVIEDATTAKWFFLGSAEIGLTKEGMNDEEVAKGLNQWLQKHDMQLIFQK